MNNDIVHTVLEWAKQAMVKCWNFNRLVNEDVIHLSCLWVIVGQCPRNCTVLLAAQGWVLAMDINRTLVIEVN